MRTRELELYTPHEVQKQFHESTARYRVASLGRQSGKSTMCLNELLAKAWANPNSTLWFVSPTYPQALIQYRRLAGMLSPCWEILLKKSQTELRLKLINGSQIRFVSGEVGDRLRGETLHGVVIDEVRDQPSDLWAQVLRPMLATTKGWAAFVSTPAGFDSFYDLFQKAEKDPEWQSFKAPSTCNPLFTQEEYEAAKKEMSEAEFDQEICANFRDLTAGKAYLNHGSHNHLRYSPFDKDQRLISPYIPILVACDFNLDPISWVLGQQKLGEFYWFDEIYLRHSHTQEATKELIERVKDHKAGIWIIGDATANAGQRAAAGQSDYGIMCKMLKDAGIKFENKTPDSNPHVKDRVNTVNSKLMSADGLVHLWYHPERCPNLKKDLERVVWKTNTTAILDQTTNPLLTHLSDAIGYAVCELTEMWRPSPGVVRVIQR